MWKMECEDTLQLMPELTSSLSLIVSGMSEDEVAKGWQSLRELEESSALKNSVNLHEAKFIMRRILRGRVLNIHQVPKLMVYFAKYVKKKLEPTDEGDPIVNDFVAFVQLAGDKDIALLLSMVEILRDYPMYGGSVAGTAKACRAIVNSLGTFQMPLMPAEVSQFRESAYKIREALRTICKSGSGFGGSELMTVCLEAVYTMISDTERETEPGPGLIALLELVETKYINQAVKWIMSESRSDAQLERALRVLCYWIPNWLKIDHLSLWIMEFISGLEKAEKFVILDAVATAHLGKILGCVPLPMSTLHATLLATIILRRQAHPRLFHQLAKRLKHVFILLSRQSSEIARRCLQDLVDVTKALMERFYDHPPIYDELEKSFPVPPFRDSVVAYRDEPVWSSDYDAFTSSSSSSSNSPPRPDAAGNPSLGLGSPEHGKVGLNNLGNTCYMNSVLQALAMTKKFSQQVMSYEPVSFSPKDDSALSIIATSAEQIAQIMPKLQDLFALLLYSPRRSLSPSEILVASRPEYFTPRQQQDSSEFLCHLLDVLYEQEKSILRKSALATEESGAAATRSKGKRSREVTATDRGCIKRWTTEEDLSEGGIPLERKTSQSLGDFTQASDDVDGEIGGETRASGEGLSDCHSDSTDSGIQSVDGHAGLVGSGNAMELLSKSILVQRVFGGESKITYQCAQCDTSSHNNDTFRDIQLCFPEEITDNQEVSVQDLMNYYLTPEKLTGENKYRCDKCTKLCDAQRMIKILRAPVHLILTLKHFHYDPETRLRTKLRHKVTYNETIKLPVSQNCTSDFSTPGSSTMSSSIAETYKLYAAVVHSGYSMDYGHYVTYARDSKENWFKFNDNYVSRTSLDEFNALEPPVTPYILFYEKINTEDSEEAGEDEKPDLSSLSKHVRDLVEKDRRAYEDEMRQHSEKKRSQRSSPGGNSIAPSIRRHDNSDDENPPPSSCRGHIDMLPNRFLF